MRLSIMLRLLAPALCAIMALAVACDDDDDDGSGADDISTRPMRVVATTTQIADFARNVAGPDVQVLSLIEPDQDPHDAELTADELKAVQDAPLVLRHGMDLDKYADKPLKSVKDERIATVTDGIKDIKDDPHVWFSVANAKRMVDNIRDALVKADAANAAKYQQNADAYLRQLDRTEAFVKSETDRVPRPCRKLVTDHEVFTYYAAAYSFEVLDTVIPGSTTASEPSARDITRVVERIRSARVPAIFAQASENPALMERVAREAGVRVVTGIYADSLGPPGSDGDTYVKMMESNTRKIVAALEGCQR